MHRSRIGLALIDHPTESYAQAARFWADALGTDVTAQDDGPYASLTVLPSVALELQETGSGTPPRVHFDIETDDVRAEVARLVGLGAGVVEERDGYTVMADPGGMVFCVVDVYTDDFERHARTHD
jgi:hypothetical protein